MKILKRLLLILCAFVCLAVLLLMLTGNSHVLTAVSKTYLLGQAGPGIHDLNYFPSRKIKALVPKPMDKQLLDYTIPKEELDYLNTLGTEAIVMSKKGQLVYEQYFGERKAEDVSNSFSAAKSIVSILVGIALKSGYIQSIDEPLGNNVAHLNNPALEQLTWRDVMDMRSGSSWQESGGNPFSDNAKAYYGKDLIKLLGGIGIDEKPGERFYYQSGNTQIIAEALTTAIGTDISTFAERELWSKINAEHTAYWSLDHENGSEKAYCCYYASATDFLRVGELYRNMGNWNGHQVVDTSYVQQSFSPTFGKTPTDTLDIYSLFWWHETIDGEMIHYARGILGQYIIILPKEEMVIVRLGNKRDQVNDRLQPKDLYHYVFLAKEVNKAI